jgi:hypothetical protein
MTATDDRARGADTDRPQWKWLPNLDPANADVPEWTYLVHLDPPVAGHAGHYLGSAADLDRRLAQHGTSEGARLLEVQVKERRGTFRLVRTWPGGREVEHRLKNGHQGNRLCPDCRPWTRRGMLPEPSHRPQNPLEPAPRPERPPPYKRGAAIARRLIEQQIAAGFSADRIAQVHVRITRGQLLERMKPEACDEAQGYRETAAAMIQAHREATTPQPATTAAEAVQHQEEGTPVSTDTAPAPALETKPAAEWMKGARTAHQLIIRQAEAGYSAGHIAGKWEEALSTYDDATATDAQREWHAGAKDTAADMIQTLRDMERAEAEQAHSARDAAESEPEHEAEAG